MTQYVPNAVVISDLRQKPEFFDVVADRIWQAWWKEKSHPIEYIADRLRENLNAEPIPFALVAHDGSKFAGTVSVIASDMEERPQYTPWVAAAWVEDAYRNGGIGAALIDRAARSIFALGIKRSYLCASRERRPFYLNRGWTQIEEDVGKHLLTIMTQDSS
jgi:N-acetylglutamate synthase-like GNAT family acetyltransferase